jgi:hypothetical protein
MEYIVVYRTSGATTWMKADVFINTPDISEALQFVKTKRAEFPRYEWRIASISLDDDEE